MTAVWDQSPGSELGSGRRYPAGQSPERPPGFLSGPKSDSRQTSLDEVSRCPTRARFFAEANAPRYNTSFYLLGWTPNTYDAHNALFNLAGTRDGTRGVFNNGGYSNPAFDALVARIETVHARRQELITEATRLLQSDVAYIPQHQQQVVWAARSNVTLVQQTDNGFPLRSVRIGN